MKAAVVREFGKPLTIEEVPAPEVGPGQILVKIAATGVCHTDLHAADGDWQVRPTPPFIPVMRAWATSSPSARACGT
jgi:alcohol dehydrogenase, propanol-preferring